jgi:hypothetical protein
MIAVLAAPASYCPIIWRPATASAHRHAGARTRRNWSTVHHRDLPRLRQEPRLRRLLAKVRRGRAREAPGVRIRAGRAAHARRAHRRHTGTTPTCSLPRSSSPTACSSSRRRPRARQRAHTRGDVFRAARRATALARWCLSQCRARPGRVRPPHLWCSGVLAVGVVVEERSGCTRKRALCRLSAGWSVLACSPGSGFIKSSGICFGLELLPMAIASTQSFDE